MGLGGEGRWEVRRVQGRRLYLIELTKMQSSLSRGVRRSRAKVHGEDCRHR